MMPPFGPEGDPAWTQIIEALLVPLFLMTACASVVWGLQDRYEAVFAAMRRLAGEYRAPEVATRGAVLEELRVLARRSRLIRGAVSGFYLTILLQLACAAWIGLLLLRVTAATLPALLLFEAGLLTLFGAIAVTIADNLLSFRAAEEEARDAGLLPERGLGEGRRAARAEIGASAGPGER